MSEPMSDPHSGYRLARPAHVASAPPAGWYADPVRGIGWRWWDGNAWTAFTDEASAALAKPPRRRPWLSRPVMVCAPLVLLGIVLSAVVSPIAILAGLVPLAFVLPVVSWFDRVEPEPRASRVHALLWGASVAVLVSLIVNVAVGLLAGEQAAAVLSAPIVEEAMKGLGVYWAVRRREVDGVSDGIVYAAWVALGFAVVEDMSYFATASVTGSLVPVFVLRALLTPFAHPLFTFWTGLAIGRAVRAGRPVWPRALWGYGLAVATHMAWNGSLVAADITSDVDEDIAVTIIVGVAVLFVGLFVAVAIAVFRMRRAEQRRFVERMPSVVLRYNVPPDEAAVFGSWRGLLHARKQLPRSRRHPFDAVHASLARLVLLHERSGDLDLATEQVLVDRLHEARDAFRRTA
jgi:RsiW-degrading membrane proteinase PrsW (M82 family)